MMAAEGEAIVTYTYNGQYNNIPRNVTHLIIHEDKTVIPAGLFFRHPNLVEVYCHAGVTKILMQAFSSCPRLRRVIIPGVTIVEKEAFYMCRNLEYVKCDKLERIGIHAFAFCESLSGVDLKSVKIVEARPFRGCTAMTEAIFGKDLESIRGSAFNDCTSLESITVPLKKDLVLGDSMFSGCVNLKRVELVEGGVLRDFAGALLCDDWRNDVNEALDSINQILPNIVSGVAIHYYGARVREWIGTVLCKIIHYKAAHRELLNEATAALKLHLPDDMVMDNILPFTKLPDHTFDGEEDNEGA